MAPPKDPKGPDISRKRTRGKFAPKENRENDPISCVNTKLSSCWNPSFVALGSTFDAFVKTIDQVVFNWNKIAPEASLFVNFHVLRLIQENKPLPTLDTSLFEACCRIVVEGSRERKEEEIRESFDVYKTLRPEEGDYTPPSGEHFTRLIGNLRRQMETCAKNHVWTNFVVRLIRFVRSRFSLSKGDAWKMVKGLFNPEMTLTEDQEWLKGWLVYNPLDDNILKKHLDHFFRLTYDLLVHQESLDPMTKGKKTFSILPVSSSFVMSHMILDRTTLQEVLQHLPEEHRRVIGTKLVKGGDLISSALSRKAFNISQEMFKDKELSDEIWRFIFCVDHLETVNRKFDYGLSTNGYDVSLRFRQTREAVDSTEHDIDPSGFDLYVGIDPGKKFIATGYATTETSEESTRFSLNEYRHKSKMNEQRIWNQRLREREYQYDTIIKMMPSMKSTNVQESIKYLLGVSDWMFRFCREKAFLKWRFKTKIYSRKTMAEVTRRITGGKHGGKTIVGLGDWSQQDGFKGTPKAPIKRMKQELKKRAVVLDIDEYRTSKTCSLCEGEDAMENVKIWKLKKDKEGAESLKLVKCHQILRCKNIDCRKCWQRDLNASRNIYGLLWGLLCGEERPSAMSRKNSCVIPSSRGDKRKKPRSRGIQVEEA